MKRYGQPQVLVTDKLRSYAAAIEVVGNAPRQETGRWVNNRAENSHLLFRRRERAMLRFRKMRCLKKFAAVHSSVHNHFNHERHLFSRDNFKLNRAAALAEWRGVDAAKGAVLLSKLGVVRIRLTPPKLILRRQTYATTPSVVVQAEKGSDWSGSSRCIVSPQFPLQVGQNS